MSRLTKYSTDLPDDIFDEGEVKPVKTKKSKASATKTGVKRPASEVDVCSTLSPTIRRSAN